MGKKIRRRRQKSLFSMTSASEYSLLDSGRVSSTFDPMNISRPFRPQIDAMHSNGDSDSREPPSLDLLAEMIKEEIRQASSLKQALERVNTETESISQRVSNISVADDMNSDLLMSPSHRTGANASFGDTPKPKKQVQFTVPDDVRFRWLGIYQQPSDTELSDNDANENSNNQETTSRGSTAAAASAPPHHEPQVTCPTPASGLGAHAHKPSTAAASTDNTKQISPDTRAASTTGAAQNHDPGSILTNGTATTEQSESSTPNDSVYAPSDASLEAVYGGSRSDTRGLSVLQSAQINSANKIASGSHAADGLSGLDGRLNGGADVSKRTLPPGDSKNSSISDGDHSQARIEHLMGAADYWPSTDSNKSLLDSQAATISGRVSHRLSASHTQSSKPRAADNHPASDLKGANKPGHLDAHLSKTTGRSANGVSPFSADPRAAASNSAFSQPSLATAKATVPKRYSVLPSFVPPQVPAQSDPASQPFTTDKSDNVRSRLPPGLQRSGSTLDAATQPAMEDSPLPRRNSYDGSSIPDRRGGLAAQVADSNPGTTCLDSKAASHRSPQHSQPPGLLRRVTTSSAHRKHNHHSRLFHDEHGGSILGGTKEFFKHRLRSRTNSSSLHSADAADDGANASEHFPDMHGSDVNAAQLQHQQRPRRRSDAEVKSRNAELPPPPPPSIPEQFQQRYPAAASTHEADKYIKSGAAKKDNTNLDSLQLLHAPRSSIGDGQSDWIAISPPPSSSSAHERDSKTPPRNALSQRQRRSHDDAIRSSADHRADHRARQQMREVGKPLDSTIRLTKNQLELLRLRPINDDSTISRSRGRRNTSDSSSPSPPPQSTRKIPPSIGRSSIERLESPHPDSVISSPPMPKMPPPPPPASLSPLSAKIYINPDSKQASPETDSLDHHMRRLRSDRKSRRSSFMSTISQMLGRKE